MELMPIIAETSRFIVKTSATLAILTVSKLFGVNLNAMSSTVASLGGGVHSIAYVTAPSEEVAKKLARGAVEGKLAACVNIIPKITSIYEWKDKIEEDSEVLMIIKTRTSRVPDLTEYIRKNHPYEVCEVISTKIEDGNPEYLKWISSTVSDNKHDL